VYRTRSVTRRIEGRGGKMYSFWAWYSFRMSFWMVPDSCAVGTPCFSATATYMAMRMGAGELIVIDVDTPPRSIPSKRSSMSARVSTATPALPTSPSASGSSESRPMRVGRSNAVESPVPPPRSSSLNRVFVSSAVPKPANMRMVQSLDRYIEA